jgi:DNA invertase Pin-like site-specific DNA recombinase
MSKRAKTGDATRAVAYIRVSTDEQALGPEAQRAAIEAWARAQGVTVTSWHSDLGVSGSLSPDRRPALMAALDALSESGSGLFVASKRDRLGRDLVGTAMLERLAERAGARVVTADCVGAEDTPEGGLLRGLVDCFAAYELCIIRARTKAALRVKALRGERTGQLPFGYGVAPDGVRLVPIPAEQTVIERVRSLRADGVTMRAIVARLNSEGAPCRGSRWHLSLVARLSRVPVAA